MNVTHKIQWPIVIYRKDDIPLDRTFSQNVGQTHTENPNRVKTFYDLHGMNIYTQYKEIKHKYILHKNEFILQHQGQSLFQKCIKHAFKMHPNTLI